MPAFSAPPLGRSSKPDFIGQVLDKASPILTWRPQKVQRIKVGEAAPPRIEEPSEASFNPVVTFSRAPTRRMVSWPVVPELPRAKPAFRALLTLITFSLLCGSALTLCVYLLLGEKPVASRGTAAARVAVAHVEGKTVDTLSSPLDSEIAAPELPSPATPARLAARPKQGHGRAPQHAQHHAAHATHPTKGSTAHRTTK